MLLCARLAACVLLVAATGRVALAERCASEIRLAEPSLAWQRAASAVRAELARRADVERCVSIELARGLRGMRVTVTLADGRTAVRHVDDPADLRAAVIALLLLPVIAAPVPVRDAGDESWVSSAPGARDALTTIAHEPPTASRRVRLDLGAGAGTTWVARVHGFAAAASAALVRAPWSFETIARRHGFGGQLSADSATEINVRTIELGAGVGYELVAADPIGLTLSVVPSIVNIRENPDDTMVGAAMNPSREWFAARFSANLRTAFRITDRFRMFVGANVGFFATPGDSSPIAALPDLPRWSGELSVGGQLRAWP